MLIEPSTDLQVINKLAPHGGLIGPGDSRLLKYLKQFKILRTHAAFHDAFGFMKEQYATGLGYFILFQTFLAIFCVDTLPVFFFGQYSN